jgi:hypothetical protein
VNIIDELTIVVSISNAYIVPLTYKLLALMFPLALILVVVILSLTKSEPVISSEPLTAKL